jgi:hypothetical protein
MFEITLKLKAHKIYKRNGINKEGFCEKKNNHIYHNAIIPVNLDELQRQS